MNVWIKKFEVLMEVKNKGMELEIRDTKNQLGDLIITKSQLIWCKGKIGRDQGKKVTWDKFIAYMEKL